MNYKHANIKLYKFCKQTGRVATVLVGIVVVAAAAGIPCGYAIRVINRERPQTYATIDSTRVHIESHEQPAPTISDVAELLAEQSMPPSLATPGRVVDFKGTTIARFNAINEDAPDETRAFGEEVQANESERCKTFKATEAENWRAERKRTKPPVPRQISEEEKEQLKGYVERQSKAIRDDHARRGIVESEDDKKFS